MITKLLVKTIHNLVPNKFFVINDGVITWVGETPNITQQQIDDEYASVLAEYNAQEYQRLRQYPSLGDQLDMLWHAIDNGTLNKTSDFYTAIKAVKDAHPKG